VTHSDHKEKSSQRNGIVPNSPVVTITLGDYKMDYVLMNEKEWRGGARRGGDPRLSILPSPHTKRPGAVSKGAFWACFFGAQSTPVMSQDANYLTYLVPLRHGYVVLGPGRDKGAKPLQVAQPRLRAKRAPPKNWAFGSEAMRLRLKLRASSFCQERKAALDSAFPPPLFSPPSSPLSLSPFFEWRRTRRGWCVVDGVA
jgi:hypothetical protein